MGRFLLQSLIAERDHAAVFKVFDECSAGFAMKVQKVHKDIRELAEESTIYRKLVFSSGNPIIVAGFPLNYWYTKRNGLEYVLMEKLGESLDDIANKMTRGRLINKDVLMIGIHALRLLRHVHRNGILHRDIKPQNFLMGEEGSNMERTLHLINFGEAITVKDWDDYDYDKTVLFAGTEYFAAAEALLHQAPTRGSDMESLAYTLVFLSYGDLPWIIWDLDTGRQIPHSEMARQRRACKTNRLCEDFPVLEEFVNVVLQTARREEPYYERLVTILEDGLSAENATDDGQYEWLPRWMLSPYVHEINQAKEPASQAESHYAANDFPTREPKSEAFEQPEPIE